jgi:hypothetical protein
MLIGSGRKKLPKPRLFLGGIIVHCLGNWNRLGHVYSTALFSVLACSHKPCNSRTTG